MIALRTTQVVTHDVDLNVVDSVAEAKTLRTMANDGYFNGDRAKEDACNGAIEAFFVSYMRAVPADKTSLTNVVKSLKDEFGTSYKVLNRAFARVKDFRGKNRAWK